MEVAVVVYDGVFDSGLAAILDVLDQANTLSRQQGDPPLWDVATVGPAPQVRTAARHLVDAEPLSRAETADLLIVSALSAQADELVEHVATAASQSVRDAIVHARERGAEIASACAGTFLLAETGVLDGLSATTTWWLAPAFRVRYPHVHIDHGKMVVHSDGITTAGAAFGHVDLALAIVRASSPSLADLVARYLVIDERPSQSTYTILSALAQNDPVVAAFERWVREHLDEPITIADTARAVGVSERTLQRSIQRVLGVSPIRFTQDLRIERATHLLRTTELSLEAIAHKVGYEHPNTLRILLRERTGKTTAALRAGRSL